MSERLRIGVVGGGLIAQTVHLPTIAGMGDRFELVGLVDPSRKVRETLSARYGGVEDFADWRELIDRGAIDAVVVCSPNASHAEVTLAALDAGVHVYVEKPLCITVEDADRICRRRDETGLVVEIGYMKRYDAGYEALIEGLDEADAEKLRFVNVVTYDPWLGREPYAARDMVVGDDVPEAVIRAGREAETGLLEAAVGSHDPASLHAYGYAYVTCMIHDVNLVHGALERIGIEVPAQAVHSHHWANGKAVNAGFRISTSAIWESAFLLLEGLESFAERAAFYFESDIHRVTFPAPYLREQTTTHEIESADGGSEVRRREVKIQDSYRNAFECFHRSVVDGAPCRTPPEQGRLDLQALQAAFAISH